MVAAKGTEIPHATFKYIPYTPEAESISACGVPVSLDTHKEWKGKKVVVISVPGAFTPTCHANHLPPFVEKAQQIHGKGVDVIAFLSSNDPFVLSAWAKSAGVKDDSIIFISDGNAEWSKQLGLEADLTSKGMGMRTSRYGLIIDDLKLSYVEKEEPGQLQMQLFADQAKKSAELDDTLLITSHPNPPNEAAAFSKYHESHHLATAPFYPESRFLTGSEEIEYSLMNQKASTYEQLAGKIRRNSTSLSRRGSNRIKSLTSKIPSHSRRNSASSASTASVFTSTSPILAYNDIDTYESALESIYGPKKLYK
ncbi:hypothetical protein E3P99_03640 [Wallemia hederae]|uniref:Putative peroxiredoxin n=1 Tax=Wallemia hederae TaxID=1540922 RepID=A0A4V4LSI3_9BASI|nr:hypothetical protein E3P99_03640 [Wallemia hederae]